MHIIIKHNTIYLIQFNIQANIRGIELKLLQKKKIYFHKVQNFYNWNRTARLEAQNTYHKKAITMGFENPFASTKTTYILMNDVDDNSSTVTRLHFNSQILPNTLFYFIYTEDGRKMVLVMFSHFFFSHLIFSHLNQNTE